MDRRVGFIGLGAMGHPMASRLVAASADVTVFDVAAARVCSLVELGARPAASARAVADQADFVLLSLPNAEAVLAAVDGSDGALRGSRIRTLIDLSTIGLRGSTRLAELANAAGVSYLDAPVSGGTAGARDGQLTIMAGGAAETLADAADILQVLSARIIHVGDSPGQGQLTKIANNLMSAAALLITAEALSLGARNGMASARMLEAINLSSGRNTASADKFPKYVLTGTFDFGFRLELMRKDLSLLQEAAAAADLPMPLAQSVVDLFSRASEVVPHDADLTAIAQAVESWTGASLRDDAT